MKTLAILFAAAALCSSTAIAGDHLDPENSLYEQAVLGVDNWMAMKLDYEQMVITELKEAFDEDVKIRVIELPSFVPESATGIRDNNGAYRIFFINPEIMLWNYETLKDLKSGRIRIEDGKPNSQERRIAELQEFLPSDYHSVKIDRCEVDIDAALALKIIRIWKQMLLQTGYDRPANIDDPLPGTFGLDGSNYHFSMQAGYQVLTGQVWSPGDAKPSVKKFVSIVIAMRQYCATKGVNAKQLESEVDALSKRLQ